MRLLSLILFSTAIFSLLEPVSVSSQPFEPTWKSLDSRPIPPWFSEAKFGIFIHWGVYSVPCWRPLSSKLYASYAEWYYARVINDFKNGGDAFHRKNYGKNFEYRDFGPMFKAELFDPDKWAEIFLASGAKYVVLTSKHHDGYCLWPTTSPYKKNWNSMAVGPKRDLVGELTTAVRAKGLKMGLYYSIIEWETNRTQRRKEHKGRWLDKKTMDKYGIPASQYVTGHLLPQLKEIVLKYQPSLIFSDAGEWDGSAEYWKTREFLAWLYNEAPNKEEVVVNDRWCSNMPGNHGDYYSSEYKDTDKIGIAHPWEESRGVGGSYGFNRAENLEDYSTSTGLIHELIDIVSRGGNLLLNVGPTADGRIPVIMQQRLADIGAWLDVNGEAIYRTTAFRGPRLTGDKFLRFTKKDNFIYILTLKWPSRPLEISGLPSNKIAGIKLLGSDVKVNWHKKKQILRITPPEISLDQAPCSHAYVFRVELLP